MPAPISRQVRRALLGLGAGLAVVAAASAPAVAQSGVAVPAAQSGVTSAMAQSGGASATPGIDSLRSVVHIAGIATSLVLAYYAYRARSRFRGGVFATSATYVVVGATGFALAFLNMELQHGFGIVVFDALGRQARLAVRMGLFAVTVFAFGRAVYLIAETLESWELT